MVEYIKPEKIKLKARVKVAKMRVGEIDYKLSRVGKKLKPLARGVAVTRRKGQSWARRHGRPKKILEP